MRLFLIISFLATLPQLVGAQCNGDEWYSTVSGQPSGVFGPSPQNTSLHLVEDGVIDVLEYYNTTEVQVEDSIFQVELCGGTGRGFLIRKTSESGNLSWFRQLCYSNLGVVDGTTVDDDGNLYVCGYFTGTIAFGVNVLAQSSEFCYFILKIDSDGQMIWFRYAEHSSGIVGLKAVDTGLMFCMSVTDSVLYDGVTFYSDPSSTSRDFQLLFTDLDGVVIWNKLISGTSHEKIYEITDIGSHSVVQGRFDTNLNFDGESLSGSNNTLFQLAVDNSNGDLSWIKQGTQAQTFGSIALNDTTLISVGFYHNQFAMDGFSISETGAGSSGYVLAQHLENGDVYWLNDFGGTNADAILSICKLNSSFAIGGKFLSPIIEYQGTTLINNGVSTEDPFLLILDKTGKPSCVIEQLGDEFDDSIGRLSYKDGYLYGLLSFWESTQIGQNSINALGETDVALFRVCSPCDTLTGLNEGLVDEFILLQNDPNPFADYTDIKYDHEGCGTCEIIITDTSGRIVKRIKASGSRGMVRIYSSELGSGMFVYSLVNDGQVVGSETMVSSKR